MNVWYHLSTIFEQRLTVRKAGLLTLCVALITTLFFGVIHSPTSYAAPGINQTISFQGRLLDTNGSPVPEGYYNIQFKIYQDGTATGGGAPKWTETYINNNGTNGVYVKNGYFSVSLGSLTAFGNSVDWNQDTLWLSMNVAGSAPDCTVFDDGTCVADGEMLPMKRITATPLALNSARLGGITADGFIQNGTSQQTGNFSISGTGIAGILQGTTSVLSALFDRADSGALSIGSTNATSVSIGSATASQTISIATGTGDNTVTIGSSHGESVTIIQGGEGGVSIATEGTVTIDSELVVEGSAVFNEGVDVIGAYSIDGVSVLDSSSLSFSAAEAATVTAASGQNLVLDGKRVQIGDASGSSEPTLLTLDRSATTPTTTGDAILGSMYYNTVLGKVQCYEADGWGACSSSPDNFVTLSPQYANAVTSNTGEGEFTSGICSDDLNINDGTSGPAICGTNETYNFYQWTTNEQSAETKDVYVTYQLPANFTGFVEGSTSLIGRTDDSAASVTYQVYKNTGSGLVACGSAVTVSTGAQSTWQKVNATGTADPYNCGFSAGQSVVFKISMTAEFTTQATNAYISTLSFAFKDN